MAQPHPQAQQRPSFSQQSQSYNHAFQQPNGRAQFSPQSPPNPMQFPSPSPQPQFPPTYSTHGPPSKRPRLSPDAPSPFSQSVGTPQAGSPVNGQANGYLSQNVSRSNLMPPPQQPVIKKESRDEDVNVFKSAGINFDEESAGLTNFSQPTNPQSSFQSGPGSFDTSTSGGLPGSRSGTLNAAQYEVTPEERQTREHQRQDWDESRHSQHELWDPFVYGATLNDRIKAWSHRNNLSEPQSGVLVNTQRNQPPPIVRVNGHEGATRVINQGQSILDTREKADRLNELVKLLSLSAKARMTGLVQAAARLSIERTQHSQGRVPEEWKDIAAVPNAGSQEQQNASSPTVSAGNKRTHSEATLETDSQRQESRIRLHPSISTFEKSLSEDLKAETSRQARRRKRTEAATAQENEANAAAEADVLAAAAGEDGKKTTKKERKLQESKITEQQQYASTNEAARMATASILGRAGKKGKSYSWLVGTASKPPSAAPTPTRSNSVAAPVREKQVQSQKTHQMGQFEESSEAGIQARDLLLVLESDGRAVRSFVRATSIHGEAIKFES